MRNGDEAAGRIYRVENCPNHKYMLNWKNYAIKTVNNNNILKTWKYFLRSFSSLPLNHSRRAVGSYKRNYVYVVLVNCFFKLAQEKAWLGELTVPP